MTITEKIAILEQISEEIKADIDKAQNCDSELLDLFRGARAHSTDAAGYLKEALKRVEEIKTKAANTAVAFPNI